MAWSRLTGGVLAGVNIPMVRGKTPDVVHVPVMSSRSVALTWVIHLLLARHRFIPIPSLTPQASELFHILYQCLH